MVGYHHILMIFIAIAIILLCMSLDPETMSWLEVLLTCLMSSPFVSWLFIFIASNTQHIPHIPLL